LYGVDCPESDQPYGAQASGFTSNEVLGEYVTVTPITTDTYGRTVAIVDMGTTCLNEELVVQGYAWVYTDYCDRSECSYWLEFENETRNANRGLWSASDPIAPWDWRQIHQSDSGFGTADFMTDSSFAASSSSSWNGDVIEVIDGDTIDVSRTVSGSSGESSDSGGGGCIISTTASSFDS
jgi:endonuclease YncB( thermonuclease family)